MVPLVAKTQPCSFRGEIRLTCCVGVCEYGPDVLFVYQGNVFFGLAECCVGQRGRGYLG